MSDTLKAVLFVWAMLAFLFVVLGFMNDFGLDEALAAGIFWPLWLVLLPIRGAIKIARKMYEQV